MKAKNRLIYQYCWSLLDQILLVLALLVLGLEASLMGKDLTNLPAYGVAIICLTGSICALVLLLYVRIKLFSANNLYERIRTTVAESYLEPHKIKDWESWKRNVQTLDELYQNASDMLDSLGDFYTCLTSPEPESSKPKGKGLPDFGITCGIARDSNGLLKFDDNGNLLPVTDEQGYPVVCSVVFDSPGYISGLRVGDTLQEIYGRSCRNQSLSKIYDLGGRKRPLNIKYQRATEPSTTMLDTRSKSIAPVVARALGDIGYLRVENFDRLSADHLKNRFQDLDTCRALILDLRGNRGGDIRNALLLLSAFLDSGVLVKYQKRFESKELHQLQFRLTADNIVIELENNGAFAPLGNQPTLQRLPKLSRSRPAVVLINNCSMSGAELIAGALKDYNCAHLIGDKTFGKGVGQDVHQIPPCIKVSITSMKFTTPLGHWPGDGAIAIADGIEPHEMVLAKLGDAFGSSLDNALTRALEYLKKM